MRVRALVAALLLIAGSSRPTTQEVSSIDFPTSGAPAAQAPFIKGVLALHAFDYEAARRAFIEAQNAQPGFAMAYWGEAMTYNDPIDGDASPDLARAALAKLAATPAARLAKAPVEKEKEWIGAVEKLSGAGDPSAGLRAGKHARDVAYAEAMKRMAEKFPNDDEIKSFYALALLGTSENGRDAAIAARAAAILDGVLAKNPQHPGALLYALCAYDEPSRAEAALKYADAYARIAPPSSRALHLASHAYAALGRWSDASALNERAMKAEGDRNYDAIAWLIYGDAQQGRYADARALLDQVDAAARDSGSPAVWAQLARARAMWLIETRKWSDARAPVAAPGVPRGAAAAELFALGLAGVRSGNRAAAANAMQQLAQLMEEATVNLAPVRAPGAASKPGVTPIKPGPKAVTPPGVTPIAPDAPQALPAYAPQAPSMEGDRRVPQVMAQQLEALMLFSEGRREEGLVLARQAAFVEALLPMAAGPPNPVKPVYELVGEMLMDLRRPKEAIEAFQLALKRNPGRAVSLLGLGRAATLARDPATAQAAYGQLKEMWKSADPGLPELREIATALAPKPSSR